MNLIQYRTYVMVVPVSDPNSIYTFCIISGLAGHVLSRCVDQKHVDRVLRMHNYHVVKTMDEARDLYLADQARARAATAESAR